MLEPSSLAAVAPWIGAVLLSCAACSSSTGEPTEPADPALAPPPGGSPAEPNEPGEPPAPFAAPDVATPDPSSPTAVAIELGDRPATLRALLPDGELERALASCDLSDVRPSRFSIAHRGAPLALPEHSREGYLEAVRQGAGIVECDVTFSADGEPVCRHSQCDLHTTTDILGTDLADACRTPPDYAAARPFADVECCASDLTLAEFRTLRAKRDGADPEALDLRGYLGGTPGWRFDDALDYATLASFADSIELLADAGVAMTPELKAFVPPPGDAERFSRETLSARMFDELRAAGVPPGQVYPQSFELDDLRHWKDSAPDYAGQAVLLDDSYRSPTFDVDDPSTWTLDFDALPADGVAFLAPPIWMLLTLDDAGGIVPSDYARAASASGLPLLTWSLERGVDAEAGGGWYYQSIAATFENEGDQLRALDVLKRDVGVEGVFSDWPATTSYFDHCRR